MKEHKVKFFNNPDFKEQKILPDINCELMLRMQGAKTTTKKNDKVIAKYFG